jgi:hypothetical protein
VIKDDEHENVPIFNFHKYEAYKYLAYSSKLACTYHLNKTCCNILQLALCQASESGPEGHLLVLYCQAVSL